MNNNFEQYLNRIVDAKNEDERQSIKKEFDEYYAQLTPDTKAEFEDYTKQKAKEMKNRLNEALRAAGITKKIIVGQNEFPLTEWLTIANFCQKTGVKPSLISQRIARDMLQVGRDYIEIPELNNLRLINVNYQTRE